MLVRCFAMSVLAATSIVLVTHAQTPIDSRTDPLGGLVAQALEANLGLAAERLAEQRAAAEVRGARGLFLPALSLESRYSRLGGVPNIGDLVNPAYAALNTLTGTHRFPTNLDITLPQRHDSYLELRQPLFNAAIAANYAAARSRHDGQRFELLAAAPPRAAPPPRPPPPPLNRGNSRKLRRAQEPPRRPALRAARRGPQARRRRADGVPRRSERAARGGDLRRDAGAGTGERARRGTPP